MRKEHINPFENKTTEKLVLLYRQFLGSEKTCIIPDNELGKIRDSYLEDFGSGHALYMLQFEFTHTLSDLWYKQNTMMNI